MDIHLAIESSYDAVISKEQTEYRGCGTCLLGKPLSPDDGTISSGTPNTQINLQKAEI